MTKKPLKRLIVLGAGEAGRQVAGLLNRGLLPGTEIACFLDDDVRLHGKSVLGIPIVGQIKDLPKINANFNPEGLIIAIAGIEATRLQQIVQVTSGFKLDLKIISEKSLISDNVLECSDIRPLAFEDVLGRSGLQSDVVRAQSFFQDETILVTGAGGSIGTALVRNILALKPRALHLLDHDENSLVDLELSTPTHMRKQTRVHLCDIRDQYSLRTLFSETLPSIVFHAAALKNLPILERFPQEAFKTNCIGTSNVLNNSLSFGINRFINVSTDKAANPSSCLGYTKHITESLTAEAASVNSSHNYLSVRFGNVLRSRGSLIDIWEAQVRRGEKLSITNPEATRFFMSLNEAASLMIEASLMGSRCGKLVMDMGEPVSISDILNHFRHWINEPLWPTTEIGLRPGEKMHEELVATHESVKPTLHPKLFEIEGLTDSCPFTLENTSSRSSVERFVDSLR